MACDADEDGDIDLFVAIRGESQVVWYENDGSQNFEQFVIADGADGAYAVIPADMDGDGDIDVVAANKYDDTIVWHENDGQMSFAEHAISTSASGVRFINIADIDQDYDLDIVGALAGDDEVVWFENACDNQVYAAAIDGRTSLWVNDVCTEGLKCLR